MESARKLAALLLGMAFGMLWAVGVIEQEQKETGDAAVR